MKRCKHVRAVWCDQPSCFECPYLAELGQRKLDNYLSEQAEQQDPER